MSEETPNSPVEITTATVAPSSTEESSGAPIASTDIPASPNESTPIVEVPVTAQTPDIASPVPIDADHETLGQELKHLVTLSEDEIKRIVAWAQEKWKATLAELKKI